MPPKSKGSSKAPNPEPKAASEPPLAPQTVSQRSQERFFRTNPCEKRRQDVGLASLTPAEKKSYTHTHLILPVADRRVPLSNKAEREFWKHVAKEGLPIRRLARSYAWGNDRSGRDIGTYSPEELEQRTLKHARLTALQIQHRQFLSRRDRNEDVEVSSEDIQEEKKRRQTMAALKRDLYGQTTGALAKDPEWDDVLPIPQDEPEGALAQIAYPDDYAEAVSYLRAVMATDECSPRCLRLTEHVISMNPAHYTVWLYRFKIISVLKLSIPDEITWLNKVALANLKNYQIWNHRQLLIDYYYPEIEEDTATTRALGRSETAFITKMLDEDAKNYHVWSYRQYLIGKLSMWTASELGSTQNLIEDDVRNNSAWSHRFYLVFSDPTASTAGALPTEHDPKVPEATVDREIAYAQEKIALAPQNQSPWNYLLGVLAKGGRKLATVQDFAEQYVSALGEEDEEVRSSHALDFLAKVYHENGDTEKAALCLRRLSEKWDPVREGYWKYRGGLLQGVAASA
ncbi:CAAX geranylgeranyltransferase alpha subunit [Neonectria magnoliae]|uniref:Protein farnesyltransferase/geranylgeranyltransferase type-1 subunit alpha n=1 Tax=Neonectria magnoliae TaxID=2732573 RepID=A0ABR1IHM4_9HYPO